MKFVGRKEELAKLNKVINSRKMSVSLIYGRRRIGKSELVKETLKQSELKGIYYECKEITEEGMADELCEMISEKFELPTLGYKSIKDILEFFFEYSVKKKFVLVLDEYPYLRDSVKGMDSILQSLIDKYRNKAKIKLVILGSYVDVMKSLQERENPLFGRVDLTIDLKQMDYYDSSMFYQKFSNEDKVKIYSVFGGVPYYNQFIDDSKSVRENIIELIASQGARFENEIPMYLNSEISKIVNANEVFEALAKGYSKYKDILSQSHVSSSPTLADVLNKLINMEVVVKEAPINDENNKKKAGYFICDNLSKFYYKYIFRHLSQLKIMNENDFYKKYIKEDFENRFVPLQYENICKQYLVRQNKQGEINPFFEQIGKYYYDDPVNKENGEFDIVTKDEEGYIFYEVKFRDRPLSKKIVNEEIEQVEKTGLFCYKYVFFTKNGLSFEETDQIKNISLDDVYK